MAGVSPNEFHQQADAGKRRGCVSGRGPSSTVTSLARGTFAGRAVLATSVLVSTRFLAEAAAAAENGMTIAILREVEVCAAKKCTHAL